LILAHDLNLSKNESRPYRLRKVSACPPSQAKGQRMERPMIESMCPFFIVGHVNRTIAFYADKLGFESSYKEPKEEPFFAIVNRDGASPFIKAGEALPLPNPNDLAMRWDAYCYTTDPDALAACWGQNCQSETPCSAAGSLRPARAVEMVMEETLVDQEKHHVRLSL